MSRFGRLKQLEVEGKTIPFELPEAHVELFCEDIPVLHLAHMGRSNKDWFNARMALGTSSVAKAVAGKTGKAARKAADDIATKEATRLDVDRDLIPAYVIKGWENLYDDEGKPVEFSTEEAGELIGQLPDDIVERMRMEAMNLENFRDMPTIDPSVAEAFVGNS